MIDINLFKLMLAVLLTSVLTACSTSSSPLLPEKAAFEPTDYLIGPGDNLNVFVWRNADLSSNVIVRPDGRISSPLIDDLSVTGLSASVVAREIEGVLSTYIKNPKVSVIVSGFNGAVNQQIRIIGSASNPQILPYRVGMTLLDIMISVNGLTDFADGDNAKLVRYEKGKPKEYTVELDSLIKGGDISKNRHVYPGDTIIIPESWY